ncbi:MAG: helix-turn-helix domain-containing protein [Flavobacteriaceae bacterium]
MELIVVLKEDLKVFIQNTIEESLDKYFEMKIEQEKKKTYLTVKEAASKLNVSELTIRNYIKRGVLNAKRIGNRILINSLDLEEKLQEVKSLKYRRG